MNEESTSYGRNRPRNRHYAEIYIDWTAVKAALKGHQAFSLHDTIIFVKTPYDPELRALMSDKDGMAGKWDAQKKSWKVHVSRWEWLQPHVDRIEQAFQQALHDRVNSEARELQRDRRIWVSPEKVSEYTIGEPVFLDGKDWFVAYIGRAKEMDGQIRHAIYMERAEPKPIAQTPDDGFDAAPEDPHQNNDGER